MWISILNYNSGQIEVHDISEYYGNCDAILSNDEIAENWLYDNGYKPSEVNYMLTDECPLCIVNNLETHLNL